MAFYTKENAVADREGTKGAQLMWLGTGSMHLGLGLE